MKKLRLVVPVLIILALLSSIAPATLAQGGEVGASWNAPIYSTWLMIQNLGTAEATVTIELYSTSGALYQTISNLKIPAGSLRYINPDTDITGTSFQGSAVVSADQPIEAVVTIYDYNNGNTAASYNGSTIDRDAGTTVFLPSIHRSPDNYHQYSDIAVQNVTSTSGTFHIRFYAQNGTILQEFDETVPAYTSKFYYTQDAFFSALGGSYFGSARIEAVTPGALFTAKVKEWDADGWDHYAYDGITQGGQTFYLPSVHGSVNTYGWQAWPMVQNLGTANAQVVVEFYNQSGVIVKTVTDTIAPYSSNYYPPINYPETSNGYFGSARVRCTNAQNVAVIVAEWNLGNGPLKPGFNAVFAYNGVASGTSKVFFPLTHGSVATYGWESWAMVQNLGSAEANVNLTFYNTDGTVAYSLTNQKIAAGSSNYYYPTAYSIGGNNWVGSLVVECTNGQALAGILQDVNVKSPTIDTTNGYNGFNQ